MMSNYEETLNQIQGFVDDYNNTGDRIASIYESIDTKLLECAKIEEAKKLNHRFQNEFNKNKVIQKRLRLSDAANEYSEMLELMRSLQRRCEHSHKIEEDLKNKESEIADYLNELLNK